MTKRVCKLIAATLFLLFAAQPVMAAEIEWLTYSEALQISREENKPIIMIFTADWCAFCKKLENQTLNDGIVKKLINDNFVAVKVDRDKETRLVKDFGVGGIPDIYVLEPWKGEDGIKIIGRQLGFIKAEPFELALREVLASLNQQP